MRMNLSKIRQNRFLKALERAKVKMMKEEYEAERRKDQEEKHDKD